MSMSVSSQVLGGKDWCFRGEDASVASHPWKMSCLPFFIAGSEFVWAVIWGLASVFVGSGFGFIVGGSAPLEVEWEVS